MSNDWEVLEMLHDKKKPIILNGEIQAYGNLRESMRKINLAILENHPESNDLAWVQDRNAELVELQPLFAKIREHNPWSSFRTVFKDAIALTHVRQRDIKEDWGYDVKEIQEWKELHYGEVQRHDLPSLTAKFLVEYKRNPYGFWWAECAEAIFPGSPDMKSLDLVGFVSEDDPKWQDTVKRFRGGTFCHCHLGYQNPELHRYWGNFDYLDSLENAR